MSGLGFQGVQAKVLAKLQGVPGMGRLYDYLRLVTTEAEIEADLKQSSRLHYWCVTPAAGDPQSLNRRGPSFTHATYQYDVHAFYAIDASGASEKDFVALVLAAVAAFETGDKKLDDGVIEAGPLQWKESDPRMLVNVACHHARLTISCREQTEP